ncbi:hypothetical protein B566_EDAN001254 [Ephemera danica]|nr:hypothetical protein B566_EDAN001254 [Ephemera danica]
MVPVASSRGATTTTATTNTPSSPTRGVFTAFVFTSSNHETSSLSKDAATRLGARTDEMGLGSEWSENEGNGTSSLAPPRSSTPRATGYRVGIYGWRKRCLYLLILALVAVEGMGKLRVVAGGIQLNGQAMVLDALVASTIRSRRGQPISIDSSRNFSVNARDHDGRIISQLFLGNVLFSATASEVVVGAESLRVTGVGGAVFDGSIQTPLVRADSGNELKLESPTRSLDVKAPLGVAIESRAGDIRATCLKDLKLQSVAGTIRLDASNVLMPGLRIASPMSQIGAGPRSASTSRGRAQDIYQLCACANGRLFLAQPEGLCVADTDVCR